MNQTTAVQTFEFNGSGLRVVLSGQEWFHGKDVCDMVGLVDFSYAIGSLPPQDRLVLTRDDAYRRGISPSLLFTGKARAVTLISEAGLYRLIIRSNKPEAQGFQDWLCREVLPSIRRTGRYEIAPVQTQAVAPTEPWDLLNHSLQTAATSFKVIRQDLTELREAVSEGVSVIREQLQEVKAQQEIVVRRTRPYLNTYEYAMSRQLQLSQEQRKVLGGKARELSLRNGIPFKVGKPSKAHPRGVGAYRDDVLEQAQRVLGY